MKRDRMGKAMCISSPASDYMYNRMYPWYYSTVFLPRRKHASMCMYSICPRDLAGYPERTDRIRATRLLSDSRFVKCRRSNGLRPGFIEGYTRPPICVRCISIRRLRSVVVPPLKWTSAIVSENFYRRVFLTPEKMLARCA